MYAIANDTSLYMPLCETSWHSLHARLQTIGRTRGATDAEEARLLRLAERAKIWLEVGEPGMSAYVERVLGYGHRCAQDRLRVARALDHLPEMEKALERGELFYSMVRELTRVVSRETEPKWLAEAKGKSLREIERMVSGREFGDLPDAPSKPEVVRHVLSHEVSASTFALVRQARKVLQEEVGHGLDDDAFIALLAERAITPGESASSRRAPHQIAVTTCDRCKRAWQDGAGQPIELDRSAVEVVECDAEHIGSVENKERASQDVSPATRRLLFHREGHRCAVPGCRAARNLHAHHVESRAHGGTGALDNLILLCSEHHRALHKGLLRQVATGDGELRWEHAASQPSMVEPAVRALVGLGFKKHEAQSFVDEACAHVGTASLDVLVREALRRSPMPR